MNAIILAAGLGSRFKEHTKNNHKALFPINGEPNLERTVKYLKQANINEIYIVTGYLSHLFDFLADKYGCKLIYNESFSNKNNMYSFKKAISYFSNSFVIDSDVVLFENVFKKPINYDKSYYFLIERYKTQNEWVPNINDSNQITEIVISSENKPSLLGISYWSQKDCEKIKDEFNLITEEQFLNSSLYWDDIPRNIIEKLDIEAIFLEKSTATELDTFEDYEFILSHQSS